MHKWLDIIKALAPAIVAVTVPGGATLGPLIALGINEAEQIGGASGADKKAHVMSLATDGVLAINAAKGSEILDPAITMAAVSTSIDMAVDIANRIHQIEGTVVK